MGKKKLTTSAENSVKKQIKKGNSYRKIIALGMAIVVIFITGYLLLGSKVNKDNNGETSNTENSLKIKKEEVNTTAKFYPYESDGVKMEVFAVKASDGTIRTAFNTCRYVTQLVEAIISRKAMN
jgi:mannitol-specific phosphotransferase system IIBC component